MEVPQRPAIPHENVSAGPIAKRVDANNSEIVSCAGCGEDLDTSNYHLFTTIRFGAGGGKGTRWQSFEIHDADCFDAWERGLDV